MKDIFKLLKTELKEGRDAVLVTIVASSGSTPRGEGAHMVVTEKGRICGTIGGGAVEHHSELVAQEVLRTKVSHTEHFRLKQNEVLDLGMICGGDVNVSFQYIPASLEAVKLMEYICRLLAKKEVFWLVLDITSEAAGAEMGGIAVCRESGEKFGLQVREGILCEVAEKLEAEAQNKQILHIEADGARFYCEKLLKPGRVYIFGGGHVSQALIPVLSAVDFRCVVLEDREDFCQPELFPDAEEIILIDNTKISDYVTIDAMDYVCIMTRGHKADLTVQAQALRTQASYIGVIGSRHKKASVFAKLKEQGFSDADLERVTTPIGLSIGAETPAEIAISIAAQLIAKRAGR